MFVVLVFVCISYRDRRGLSNKMDAFLLLVRSQDSGCGNTVGTVQYSVQSVYLMYGIQSGEYSVQRVQYSKQMRYSVQYSVRNTVSGCSALFSHWMVGPPEHSEVAAQ